MVEHFVLVHGASHGAWSWYKIRCLLETAGHKVTCPDLRSAGIDPSCADTIVSLQDYVKPLHDVLAAIPEAEAQGQKVILVGHSAGGTCVTSAIHKFPEKIKVAVYAGASMLRNGFLTEQDIKDGVPDLSRYGEIYDYNFGEGPDNPPTSVVLKKEVQRKILYQRSPLEDCTLAAMLLRPHPTRAFYGAKFPVDGKAIDNVPRVYIKTMDDNVLSPEQQNAMIKRWPPSDVYAVDSDHCPIFSASLELFGLLLKVAKKFGQQQLISINRL